jgi:DNA topoisomerase-1
MAQPSEETCPKCGRTMVIRVGRFGKFLACSGYPDCKTTMPYLVKTGISCPQCDGELVQRISKKKRVFYGCNKYPKCQFTVHRKPLAQHCPDCGSLLIQYGRDSAKCVGCQRRVKLSEMDKQKEEAAA